MKRITANKLQEMVDQHGSVDRAARAGDFPRDEFRQACRDAGVKKRYVRRGSANAPVAVGEVSREEILEAENRELRASANRDRQRDVLDARLLELVGGKVAAKLPIYKPAPKQRRASGTPHRFCLQWSDIHAAEVVNEEAIGGLNKFNWDIMLRRHETMRQSVLSFRENRPYLVEGLHIWAVGDMVTGDIHDELRETNEVVLTEATIQLALDMAEWIEGFIPEFPWITVDGVFGNHGRRSKKPQFKQAYDNWDWLFYKILETRLAKYESVTVTASKAATLPVKVFDRTCLLWHGDGVPSNMPGVPWGGIQRRSKELSDTHAKLGRQIDHFVVGHYHEPNITGAGRILMNGSVKGPDEYSLARFGGGAPAAQNLFTFHPRRGLTDWSRLDLSEVR